MAQVGDPGQIWTKRKAITALFSYAVWQEQGGERRTIDAFLNVARASESDAFMWAVIGPFIPALFNQASPRTIVLTSPHVPWDSGSCDEDSVAKWAAAASEIPVTEEVGQNVIDALLHIASIDSLRQYIPLDIWAWLKRRPSLPPICLGRSMGTGENVVRLVRQLGDAEILTSYFLLVWSEWDFTDDIGCAEMQVSIQEDLHGIRLGHHRRALVERLDHVLRQLDRGPQYLKQSKSWISEAGVQLAKERYNQLKYTVLEVDREATEILTRTPFRLVNHFDSLTSVRTARISLDIHLCASSFVTVAARDSVPNLRTSYLCAVFSIPRAKFAYNRLDISSYLQPAVNGLLYMRFLHFPGDRRISGGSSCRPMSYLDLGHSVLVPFRVTMTFRFTPLSSHLWYLFKYLVLRIRPLNYEPMGVSVPLPYHWRSVGQLVCGRFLRTPSGSQK